MQSRPSDSFIKETIKKHEKRSFLIKLKMMFSKIKNLFKTDNKSKNGKVALFGITEYEIMLRNTIVFHILNFYNFDYQKVKMLNVTSFLCKELENKSIRFTITLDYPGRLIGKGGENINRLEEYLNRVMEQKVNLEIHEADVWKVYPQLLNTKERETFELAQNL